MADQSPDPSLDHWSFKRSDLQLLRQTSADTDFAIPDRLKLEALYQIAKILADPDANDRIKATAKKTMAMFDRNDIMRARLRIDAERLELERAKLSPPKETQARDAWSDLLRDLDRADGYDAPQGPAGGLPANDTGPQPLE